MVRCIKPFAKADDARKSIDDAKTARLHPGYQKTTVICSEIKSGDNRVPMTAAPVSLIATPPARRMACLLPHHVHRVFHF